MKYIYCGILTKQMSNWINDLLQEYSHVVEVLKLPDNWAEWTKNSLVDYTVSEHTLSSRDSIMRKTKKYGLLRNEACRSVFLFFKSYDEKNLFLRDFECLVLNANPFKTVF